MSTENGSMEQPSSIANAESATTTENGQIHAGQGDSGSVGALPTVNGLRNGHNGLAVGTNASAQAVLQRGLEVLKESEVDTSIEEIKKLDSQIDHFNNYLDKFEAKNKALNEKLNTILETQKQERLKRRASFQQKEAEYKEQNEQLEDQMRALLNRCHQARRVSAAPDVPPDHVTSTNGVTEHHDSQSANGTVPQPIGES